MKLTCNRDDLINNISIVQKAVSSNSTNALLNGILIEASSDNKIKLTGYDLQTGIEADVTADVFDKGSIVVDSKLFGEIIRKLPENDVDINVDSNFTMKIECGSVKFKISGMDPENFPRIPEIDETTSEKIVIPQKMLKGMINHTFFAISKDTTRPVLTGSNLVSDGSTLSMVSIDGFRMAINKEDMGADFPKINYIVPGKALGEMKNILSDDKDAEIILYTSMQNLLFDIGNVRMVSRLIEGNFINFDSISAKNPTNVMKIDRKALFDAVDRATLIIVTDDRKCPVQFTMSDPSVLNVTAQSEQGDVHEEIDVEVEGDLVDVDFNSKYILDALKNIDDDVIKIEVNGTQGPCIIKPVEGEKYIYLILPIRR